MFKHLNHHFSDLSNLSVLCITTNHIPADTAHASILKGVLNFTALCTCRSKTKSLESRVLLFKCSFFHDTTSHAAFHVARDINFAAWYMHNRPIPVVCAFNLLKVSLALAQKYKLTLCKEKTDTFT